MQETLAFLRKHGSAKTSDSISKLLNISEEYLMGRVLQGLAIGGKIVTNPQSADDTLVLECSDEELTIKQLMRKLGRI